jgi:hypothetical protein
MKLSRLLVVFLVVIAVFVFFLIYARGGTAEGFSQSEIPNTIWAFWDGDIPPQVHSCIDSWKRWNPSYMVVVLNKQNLQEYLPDVDLVKMKHVNDAVQRFSDFVRIHIMAKYGGIWLDGSTICNQPLDWIHKIQKQKHVEFIGYYTDMMTFDEYRDTSPVLENWTFACIPDSTFATDWRDEMVKMTTYDQIKEYSRDVIDNQGVNPQNIYGVPDIEYFAMHLAAQRLLQKQRNKYKLHLICAEDTALSYLCDPGTHVIDYSTDERLQRNVKRLVKREYAHQPLLKLPGFMRGAVEQATDDFSFIG